MTTATILALDSATEICSIALQTQNHILIRECKETPQHSKIILSLIDEVLAEAGITMNLLEALAFSCGPGSFTGVRLAASLIQGFAFAIDKPIIAISTLAALAQTAVTEFHAQKILVALDARMQEIYWGNYQWQNGILTAETEIVCKPSHAPVPNSSNWVGIGSGWKTYSEILTPRTESIVTAIYPEQQPHAKQIVELAQQKFAKKDFVPLEQALPNYLRNNVTHQK